VSRAPEPVQTINAVTLVTADMLAAVEFYLALGFRAVAGGRESEFTTFRAGDGFLNLQLDRVHAPIAGIWGRVIFWVADVDEMYATAVASGYTPSTVPADAPWGERYFHIADPDGHELSFARPLRSL
jgi:catechol 2,3-dioxygenase-like lactoylglutathione lyase family enzyme